MTDEPVFDSKRYPSAQEARSTLTQTLFTARRFARRVGADVTGFEFVPHAGTSLADGRAGLRAAATALSACGSKIEDKSTRDGVFEMVDKITEVLRATRQPLRCPDCGSEIWVETETAGQPYLTYERPASFECAGLGCDGAWSLNGAPR